MPTPDLSPTLSPALSAAQKKTLSAIRKLLGSTDPAVVWQGLELLDIQQDLTLYEILGEGIHREYAFLRPGPEIEKRVRAAMRAIVTFFVGGALGLLDAPSFTLYNQPHLTSISPLSRFRPSLPALTQLDLSWNHALTDLSPLRALPNLTSLDLSHDIHLSDLSPLADLPKLERLNLANTREFRDLSPLAACTQLRELDLTMQEHPVDLRPLAACTQLRHLDLRCTRFTHADALSPLTHLQRFS